MVFAYPDSSFLFLRALKMDSESNKNPAKMSGYLEKKGRKKMMSCYKKYWFVLEGKLLLYYRSKEEYEAISPCKGSINMGPTCNVKPCCLRVGVFQIVSRTTTITLRAESREDQHKWMQAIMTALNQSSTPTKLSHFRYSLGELSPEPRRVLERQNTMPERINRPKSGGGKGFIEKLQRIGAHASSGQNGTKLTDREERTKEESVCEEFMLSDNGKYETCCKKLSISDCESIDCSFDNAYERIPSRESMDRKCDNTGSQLDKKSKKDRPASLFTDNSNYYLNENTNRPNSVFCDQTTYCSDENCSLNNLVHINSCTKIEDYLSTYSEPRYEEIDFNKNSVNGKNHDYELINEKKGSNELWTSGENFFDQDDVLPVNEACKNMNKTTDQPVLRKFKGFGKTKNKLVKSKSEEHGNRNLKKTDSFLQRVWRKKYRNKNKREEIGKKDEVTSLKCEENVVLPPLNILQDILDGQKNSEKEENQDRRMAQNQNHERKYENLDMIRKESPCTLSSTPREASHTGPPLPLRGQKLYDRSSVLVHEVPKNDILSRTKEMLMRISLEEIMHDIEKERLHTTKEENEDTCEDTTPQKGKTKVRDLIKKFDLDTEEPVELRLRKNSKNQNDTMIYERDSSELNRLLDELSKVTSAPIMTPGVTSSMVNPDISDEELLKLIPIRKRRTSDPDYDVPRSYQSLTNLPTKKEDNDLRGTRFFGPILRPFDIHNMERDKEPPSPKNFSNYPSMTPDSLELENQFKKFSKSEDNDLTISYHSHDYLSFNQSHHRIEYPSQNSHRYEDCQQYAENSYEKFECTPLRNLKYADEIIYDTPKNVARRSGGKYDSFENDSNDSVFIDSLEVHPPLGSTAF